MGTGGWKVERLPDGAVVRGSGMSSESKRAAAAERRRVPSSAERLLWAALKDAQVSGFRFKRETEILGWFADFYCAAARLVVEVDGREHARRRLEDNRRDEVMRANHYRVLRILARRVYNDRESVIEQIRLALDTPWAQSRRDRIANREKPSRGRTSHAQGDLQQDPPPGELSERRSPQPLKRLFACSRCRRRFVTDVNASRWIECRVCCVQPRPVCRACDRTVDKVVTVHGWRCRECEAYHQVAVESAGPGGNRSLGPPPQSLRAKRYMGPR